MRISWDNFQGFQGHLVHIWYNSRVTFLGFTKPNLGSFRVFRSGRYPEMGFTPCKAEKPATRRVNTRKRNAIKN